MSFSNDAEQAAETSSNQPYLLPYNDVEIQRLQVQQRSMAELFEGRIMIAPVELKEDCEVLDVATGSGVWALDFAERFPGASNTKITGIDISAHMFPGQHPSNVTFQLASALAMPTEWTDRFTLVHQRLILSGIKSDEWEQDIKEIHRVTAPGGWAQICEWNMYQASRTHGAARSAETKTMDLLTLFSKEAGVDYLCTDRIEGLMKAAGFVDVRKEERVVPLGAWNGDLSGRFADNMLTVFRGFKDALMKMDGLGIIERGEDYDALIDEVEREWASGPGSFDSYVVFVGRKP